MVVLGEDVAVGVGQPEALEITGLAEEEDGGTLGGGGLSGVRFRRADGGGKRDDAREQLRLLALDATQEVFRLLDIEIHAGFQRVLDSLHLPAVAFVDGVHGVRVELFIGFEDGGIFADGLVNILDAGTEDAADAQVLF